MSTRKWIFVLIAVIVAATSMNVAIFMGGADEPALFAAKTAVPKHPHAPPPPIPASQPPIAQPRQIPGPSTGEAPRQMWWPVTLTAEQAARRAASDALLMRSRRLDDNASVNVRALEQDLIAQRYDEVERKLDDMLAKSMADPAYDFVERDISDFVDGSYAPNQPPSPRVEQPVIDAWVNARPNSAWAHLSAGLRWIDQAGEARGDGYADEVTDEHFAMMHRDGEKGRAELKKALALNPKILKAWISLMNIDRMDSGSGSVWQDYILGSAQRPATFLLPDVIEISGEPRWGGNYEIMETVASKAIARIGQNPRFWELRGSAAADRANVAICERCGTVSWVTGLQEYNSALANSDRPTWLAAAGDAAIHLKRYAVAYRYFERAYAYEPQATWKGEMQVLQALCDPDWSREKFETLRQESVLYGFIQDRDYPRTPGDCRYQQAELPWADEALSVVSGAIAYNVDPEHAPIFQVEPRPVTFSKGPQKLASPDGAFAVIETSADAAGTPLQQIQLQETATGKTTHLYTYASNVEVVFNSIGKRLIVQGDGAGTDAQCLVFDLTHDASHIDLLAEFNSKIASTDPAFEGFKLGMRCAFFWNDDVLTFGIHGVNPVTHESLSGMYRYDASNGSIVSYSSLSKAKSP